MASLERIRTTWLGLVRQQWGPGPHMSCLAGMDLLVRELLAGIDLPEPYLHEFGRRCAVEEFTLDDAIGWLTALRDVCTRRIRLRIDDRNAVVTLTLGWVDGTGERTARAHSQVTSMHVLELRLHQQYDRCAALGVRPNDAHALAVFEADVGDLGRMARAALLEVIAAEARRLFRHGETISATPTGRLVILAERHARLHEVVHRMVAATNASPIAAGTAVRGWIEPLANERLHLDSHMASLSC